MLLYKQEKLLKNQQAPIGAFIIVMARKLRLDIGGCIYHVYNRANAKSIIFRDEKEYLDFEKLLYRAKEKFNMGILDFTIMPNHWHFVLQPRNDGDLARFMHWLCLTNAKRLHVFHQTTGTGHIYQDRYQSKLVENNEYLLQLLRYVERNPVRAGLVKRAQDWRWSSLWIRTYGTDIQKQLLREWPIPTPPDYLEWINKPLANEDQAIF